MYSRVHIRTTKRDFGSQRLRRSLRSSSFFPYVISLLLRARAKAVGRADSRTVCAAHQTTMNSPKVIVSVAQMGCT